MHFDIWRVHALRECFDDFLNYFVGAMQYVAQLLFIARIILNNFN